MKYIYNRKKLLTDNVKWHIWKIASLLLILVTFFVLFGSPVGVSASSMTGTVNYSSGSWINDPELYSGGGVGNQEGTSGVEGKGESGWLAKAIAGLLASIGDGLLSMLNRMGLSLDLMIFGRVKGVAASAGITVENSVVAPYTFELVNGNIYGAVAGMMYGMLRTMCLSFLTVYMVYKFAAAAYSPTGKQLAELKEGVISFAISGLLIFIVPNVVDLMLYIRDFLLYLQSNTISALGGSPSVTGNMWNAYNANPTVVNAAMCIGACLLTIYLGATYVGGAVGMLVLFAIFPICAVIAQYDKRLLGNWFKEMLGSALSPVFDCLLLIVPCLMGRYLSSLYVIQFLTCLMIPPARHMIRSALGLSSVTANTMGMAAFGGVMGSIGVARAVARTAGMTAFGIGRSVAKNISGAVSDSRNAKKEGALAKAEAEERSSAIKEADGTAVREEIARLDEKAKTSESRAGELRGTGIKGTVGEAAAYDNLAQNADKEAGAYRALAAKASDKASALRMNAGNMENMPVSQRDEITSNISALEADAAGYRHKADSSDRQAQQYRQKAADSRELASQDKRAKELRSEIESIKSDATNRRISGMQRLAAVDGVPVDEVDAALNSQESAKIENLQRNGEKISAQIAAKDTAIADKDMELNHARDVLKRDKGNVDAGMQKYRNAQREYRDFIERGGGSETDRDRLKENVSSAKSELDSARERMNLSEANTDRIESERSSLKAERARLVQERDKNTTALNRARSEQETYAASHSAGIGRDGNLNRTPLVAAGSAGGAYSGAGQTGLGAAGHPNSEYEAKVEAIKRKGMNYKNFEQVCEMEGVQLSHQEKAQLYKKRAVIRTAQGIGGAVLGTAGTIGGMGVGAAVGLGMESFTMGHTAGNIANFGISTGGILGGITGTVAGMGLGTAVVNGAYGIGVASGAVRNKIAASSPAVANAMTATNLEQLHREQTVTMTRDMNVVEQVGRVKTISGGNNIQPGENAGSRIADSVMQNTALTVNTERQVNVNERLKIQENVAQTQAICQSLGNVNSDTVRAVIAQNRNMDIKQLATMLAVGSGQSIGSGATSDVVDKVLASNPEISRRLGEIMRGNN